MSRSNPDVKLNNPASKFFKWNGQDGVFSHYDKELKEDVVIPFPVRFLVLDELATVTGFEKRITSSIYSNEVHRVGEEQLRVQCFNGKGGRGYTIAQGLYGDIKEKLAAVTGEVKYTASVYVMYKKDAESEFEMANFHFHGSSLNAWIEFKKVVDVFKGSITVNTYKEATNGAITYRYPAFESNTVTEATQNEAMVMDKELQEYLEKYKASRGVKETDAAPETTPVQTAGAPEGDIIDQGQPVSQTDTVAGPGGDLGEPGAGDDLPF